MSDCIQFAFTSMSLVSVLPRQKQSSHLHSSASQCCHTDLCCQLCPAAEWWARMCAHAWSNTRLSQQGWPCCLLCSSRARERQCAQLAVRAGVTDAVWLSTKSHLRSWMVPWGPAEWPLTVVIFCSPLHSCLFVWLTLWSPQLTLNCLVWLFHFSQASFFSPPSSD